MSAADAFAEELRVLCRQYGYRSVEVTVMCDGSVTFAGICPRGYNVTGTQWGYLPTPGCAPDGPTPGQALACMNHVHAEPVCK